MTTKSKISFLDSLVKIGYGFYEIFGIFDNVLDLQQLNLMTREVRLVNTLKK
ncbi:hypothetical protein bvRMA01_001123 (plasmid) [Borrelia venezuelensis]|nr:hypothetical protein [Borrelia venezuelensis]UPA12782.1 hypothetical protein bvRMA01_001123 [Borrelia venezuelensis]